MMLLKEKRECEKKNPDDKVAPFGSFPAHCVFSNSPCFRTKAPSPTNGQTVCIEGRLTGVVISPDNHFPHHSDNHFPHHFEVRVESITFLGRAIIAPPTATPATPTPGKFFR